MSNGYPRYEYLMNYHAIFIQIPYDIIVMLSTFYSAKYLP